MERRLVIYEIDGNSIDADEVFELPTSWTWVCNKCGIENHIANIDTPGIYEDTCQCGEVIEIELAED